jgi:hypothetical protein
MSVTTLEEVATPDAGATRRRSISPELYEDNQWTRS